MASAPHINQPGGRFRASLHSNIRGRERELRAMADAVRRLVSITVTNTADAGATARAAQAIAALADALEAHVPQEPPSRYAISGEASEPHDFFQYDPVLGIYNPVALPVQMEWEPPRAIGRAHFTTVYEGPPGCVHGAVLAGVFDQVFNVANLEEGVAGPTSELTLRYRKPTPLQRDLVFEGWVERVRGRRVTTLGRVSYGDTLCVEAEGTFVTLSHEHITAMAPEDRE